MRKGLIASVGVLFLVISFASITPSQAATTWGVTVDELHKYELASLKYNGVDYTGAIGDEFEMNIAFDSFNDTGYDYTVYNSTGDATSENSTVFVEMPVDEENVILPSGLPIALPLSIGIIPDYLYYFGQFINISSSLTLFEELLLNLTEYANVTYSDASSTLDSDYFKMFFNLFATEVDATMLTDMMGDSDVGSLFPIPSNLTDFTLNATINYNATTGLFYSFKIIIRSFTQVDDFTTNFDLDIVFRLYVPPPEDPEDPEEPTDPEPTEESPYPWLIPTLAAFGILLISRRKRKS